jgi:hypothetical protein
MKHASETTSFQLEGGACNSLSLTLYTSSRAERVRGLVDDTNHPNLPRLQFASLGESAIVALFDATAQEQHLLTGKRGIALRGHLVNRQIILVVAVSVPDAKCLSEATFS